MKYKLLAVDLDGTLVTDDKKITERTRRAVRAMLDEGGSLVLSSGRPSRGVWPVAKELELDKRGGYILAYNGGELLDCRTGETIFSVELPRESIPRIIGLARQHGTAILTYEGGDIITETPEDIYVLGEARNVKMGVRQVEDLASYITFPIVKLMMVGPEEKILEMEPIVREALGPEFAVFRSEAYHLEILPAGIDKGTGLLRTLASLGIPREASAACGDYDNDIPMVLAAGLGAAVANGCPAILEKAGVVVPSNEEDGAAVLIESYILEEEP